MPPRQQNLSNSQCSLNTRPFTVFIFSNVFLLIEERDGEIDLSKIK